MTTADILIGLGVIVAWALICSMVKRICERVRAARWRRIREPSEPDNCGDDGGRPRWGETQKHWKAGD